MSIFISHTSALEYWRIHREAPALKAQRRKIALPRRLTEADIGLVEQLDGLKSPLHVMLGRAGARKVSRQATAVRQHVFSSEVIGDCFVNCGEGLFVSSPEFVFLQLAAELSLVKLILLGYELCGRYSLGEEGASANDSAEADSRGFDLRPPLTDTARIAAFLQRMTGVKGHKKATLALRYISDNSLSPMETRLAILLTLPYRLGGYHLLKPKHNDRIVPVKTARNNVSKKYYECDLFWPDYDLAVEYDSDRYHTGASRIAEDAGKRNALALMGITVITVTSQQFTSISEFEKVAQTIALCLNKRMQYKKEALYKAQRELRRLL